MEYRCDNCGAMQWRGLFLQSKHYLRWGIVHGIAIGICGSATKALFTHFGYTTDGWRNGLASLAVCAVLVGGFYLVSMALEAGVVSGFRCRTCGKHGLRSMMVVNTQTSPNQTPPTEDDIVTGGLYACRKEDGTYRIVKVLVVDELAVHLRSYANRFNELPQQVSSSELSMGSFGSAEGFGIGHFPVAREGFDRGERVLVGREPVADDELDGYRIWAGIEPE